MTRLPTLPLVGTEAYWRVPFDEADPVNTPRDLDETNPQVVQAMKDAIAYLRSKNIPMDATWGSLQVAGDTGAPADPARRRPRRRGRQRQRPGLAQPGAATPTATRRSPTAPRTSRRSRSSTAAASTPRRS